MSRITSLSSRGFHIQSSEPQLLTEMESVEDSIMEEGVEVGDSSMEESPPGRRDGEVEREQVVEVVTEDWHEVMGDRVSGLVGRRRTDISSCSDRPSSWDTRTVAEPEEDRQPVVSGQQNNSQ